MPQIIETQVFQYAELNDAAKEKAREWYRSGDNFQSDFVIDDAKEVGAIIGLDIDDVFFTGFSSQGDGACFTGSYRYAKNAPKRIREYAPQDSELHRIADELQAVQKRYFYKLESKATHSGHYYHAYCMNVETYHGDDQYRDIGDAENDVKELLRDFANWIYSQLEKEYDYQNSDEAVAENIIANEYAFTETGKRFG